LFSRTILRMARTVGDRVSDPAGPGEARLGLLYFSTFTPFQKAT
jgi:hypothetical protein